MSDKQNMDEFYMKRTFDLAEHGRGLVSPNPLVGCVIVKDGQIIGEGFHKQYGGAHAEVNAIQSVADINSLKDSTLYVNLEPCAHYGKTPPCADLIVQYPFKKIVICNKDSNPLVGGKGIEKILNAGIEVKEGVLSKEGRELNKRFFTFIEKKRPYIILKWAQTSEGFIAKEDFSSKWISNDLSRKLVHKWRSEEDAVMIGTNTAIYDNPKLNIRDWLGRNPVRVVVDNQLRIPATHYLLDGTQKTICYNFIKSESHPQLEFVKTEKENALHFILNDLYERKIQSLIVEGGTKLFNEFISNSLWDEIRVFKSEVKFEKGIQGPLFSGVIKNTELIQGDVLEIFNPINA